MKKLLSMVALAAFMTACNDDSSKVETTTTDSTNMTNDAMATDTSMKMDTSMAATWILHQL